MLHNKGFVWDDVSPNNMISDENENVWIINFGGGYTEGLVKQEDLPREDLDGLKRFKEYLLDVDRMKTVPD